MEEKTAHLLADALRHFSGGDEEESAAFLIEARQLPASRSGGGETSRQGQHQRFYRTKYRAIASAYLRMADDPELSDLVFDPDFARLRPSSAGLHTRLNYLAERYTPPAAALARSWERLVPRFVSLLERIPVLDEGNLLCFHSVIQALNVGPMYRPRDFALPFRDLWKDLGRKGLLQSPYVKIWIAMVGAYSGQPAAQVEMLMNPDLRAMDLLDGLLFARHDCTAPTLHALAEIVRGGAMRPNVSRAGLAEMPRSSWLQLGAYVRACVRMPTHDNQGLIMMLLSWVSQMTHTGLILAKNDGTSRDVARLVSGLKKIEAVQVLEKSRFWRVIDQTPCEATRKALTSMWYAGLPS